MKIAICGTSGVVGTEIIKCLYELKIPISKLTCFASERSAGQQIDTPFGEKTLKAFTVQKCTSYDFVFLCVSGTFSKRYGKILAELNNCVIDSSSHFRYDEDIPLIIPEINGQKALNTNLLANPNCTTAILAVALYPLYQEFGLKKTIISTYQAASGAGWEAMEELRTETRNYLDGLEPANNKFSHPIPFNLIPAIDTFQENGYTKEEMKVVWETRKIFGDDALNISVTAVRIPTFRVHSESVTIETEKKITIDKVRQLFANTTGLVLADNIEKEIYPMPITSTGQFEVSVGRIRKNLIFGEYGLDFFICGDQLLKGAALNAVQIAKYLIDKN